MTQQPEETSGLPALEQWNTLVQALLDQGYSTLNAYEAVHIARPGLWLAAVAESTRAQVHLARHRRSTT